MTARKVLLGIGSVVVVAAVFVIYEIRDLGLDHTGVPLRAPAGEPQVQSAPIDWATEQTQRRAAKAAFLKDKADAFDWFARFPFSEVDGIPLIILKLLPTVAPNMWKGGDDFLSEVGLFADARFDNKMLPTGVGFSGLSRAGSADNIDYTSFTCAACHIGRVDTGGGTLEPIIGGINSEFNINLFFLKLHQTIEHLYADEQDPAMQAENVRVAFLSALEQATKASDTFFYENFSWNGLQFDADYEAEQISLFKANGAQHIDDFVHYTKGFVTAFSAYLDKTYGGFQQQMLNGFPGMADATGVSAAHGYEQLVDQGESMLASFLLPTSPGLTDYMPVWEQATRTAQWDETQKQLINGGGQYNGNIPIPIYRNLAASLTMGLTDTDLRVAAFTAELLDNLPAPPYPFGIDETMAKKGEVHFKNHCAACHQPHNGKVYAEMGTSMGRAGVINIILMLGARDQYKELCSPTTEIKMRGKMVRPCETFDGVSLEGRAEAIMRPLEDQVGYNATALRGVWATAPYLHNGSIPTIHHLLMPGTRPIAFTKGRLDYDTKMLGYVWESSSDGNGYVFDTGAFSSLSNSGHDTDIEVNGLTHRLDWSGHEEEALELIEYLKTL